MKQLIIALSTTLLLIGCPNQTVRSPNPTTAPDSELCGAMCTYLIQLGCDEGKPLYDSDLPGQRGITNQTCEGFCVKQQANGIFVNPRCVMKAPSCTALEDWRVKTNCN